MQLNELALRRCQPLLERSEEFGVGRLRDETGACILDCGVDAPGGLASGVELAEVCLAGLGQVALVPSRPEVWPGPAVQVRTDHPVAACMASQYAGWQIASEKFHAMGSGPMRAARGREELFNSIGFLEQAERIVGVLESRKLPDTSVCTRIARECSVGPERVTLLIAPTASLAGSVQIVARTIETCLHKMHELGFDLSRVAAGYGIAPLPPVAADDLTAIGRTNDAVLYGGEVTLWVRGDDRALRELGPRIPSCSSADHGVPFAEIFERYERDFYRIDPLLFSPACVTLINLDSGRSHCFGQVVPEVLRQSFGSAAATLSE
jgi:methenyltetrahydromethanopterin cyclohydrolase